MKSLSLVGFFVLGLIAFAHGLPNHITNSYYPTHSSHVMLGFPNDDAFSSSASSSATLSIKHPFASSLPAALPETEVIDFVAYSMGLSPIDLTVDRSAYPELPLFQRPGAAVVFVLDGFASQLDAEYQTVDVVSTYTTTSSLSTIETILSGTTPSVHAIVGDAWYNSAQRQVEEAFSGDAVPNTPSFLDLVSVSERSRSLVFSVAHNAKLAALIGAAPQRQEIQTLAALPLDLSYLETKLGSCGIAKLVSKQNELRIELQGLSTTFHLKDQHDLDFLSELQALFRFAEEISCPESTVGMMTGDAYPDLFTIALSSLSKLEGDRRAVAQQLMDHAISLVSNTLSELYTSVLNAVIAVHPTLPAQLQAACASLSQQEWVADVALLPLHKTCPMIYTAESLSAEQISSISKQLNEDAAVFGVAAYTMPSHQLSHVVIHSSNSSGSGSSTKYTENEVAVFQINLWTSIVLFLTVVAVISGTCVLTWEGMGSPVFIETNTIQRNMIEGYKE